MSDIHNQREIENLQAEIERLRVDNDQHLIDLEEYRLDVERLRAALREIINVKPYYGAEADEMLNIARAALEGKHD